MHEATAYRVAAGRAEGELREKGSRFLALVEPVADEAAARRRIKDHQQQYRSATHVCWAWRTGAPPVEGCSDAGEPAGTAGMPMLQVLRGADLSDTLAVVVRWFGGTKLGRGGLSRAYSGAVKAALENLPVTERRLTTRLRVVLPYSRVGDLKRLVHPPEIEIVEEVYGDEAAITVEIERSLAAGLSESIEGFATEIVAAGTESSGRNRLDSQRTDKEERSS